MATRASISSKPKKKKVTFSRRARTGIDAAPTEKTYYDFSSYIRVECDKKEVSRTIKDHVKETKTKEEAQIILSAPEWMFASSAWLASAILWKQKGKEFPQGEDPDAIFEAFCAECISYAENSTGSQDIDSDGAEQINVRRKTPIEIIEEKTNNFITEIDSNIDQFFLKEKSTKAILDMSIYQRLRSDNAPYNMAKTIYDFYNPFYQEIDELVSKKTEDLCEAYEGLSIKERKQLLEFVKSLVEDAERYMLAKKAVRKTRTKRPRNANKQVEKLQYMKESAEFKLMSIDPTNIVGSMRLYCFNTKNRVLTELVSRRKEGFEVKGTTIQGLDIDSCRSIKLRKPEDILPGVLNDPPAKINKTIESLTTKPTAANGRINKDTVILRILNK